EVALRKAAPARRRGTGAGLSRRRGRYGNRRRGTARRRPATVAVRGGVGARRRPPAGHGSTPVTGSGAVATARGPEDRPPSGARRRPEADYSLVWLGQSVSLFGSAVTTFALPLVAVLTLSASPAEVSLLVALGLVPVLLAPLYAGPIVDRVDRRRVLLSCDSARAVVIVSIPVLSWLGLLTFPLLLV